MFVITGAMHSGSAVGAHCSFSLSACLESSWSCAGEHSPLLLPIPLSPKLSPIACASSWYNGAHKKSMKPVWHLPICCFLLSMKGEILSPRERSRSPCRKNSDIILSLHCLCRCQDRKVLLQVCRQDKFNYHASHLLVSGHFHALKNRERRVSRDLEALTQVVILQHADVVVDHSPLTQSYSLEVIRSRWMPVVMHQRGKDHR